MLCDENGVLWCIFNEEKEEKATDYTYKSTNYFYVVRLDVNSGSIINQKRVIKSGFWERKDSPSGNTSSYKEEEMNLEYIFLNGMLFGYGELDIFENKEKMNGDFRKEITEWRLLSIDNKGKSKLFKFKGKGIEIEITKENNYTDTDISAWNSADYVSGNSGPLVIVGGGIQRGKMTTTNNVVKGETFYDDVIMQYNIATGKVIWQKTYENNYLYSFTGGIGGIYFCRFENTPANKILVFDRNGNGPDTLTTPSNSSIVDATSDTGYIYLRIYDYLAKYSLPAFKFATNFVNQNKAEQFSLAQNYPNPFNPVTVIRYQLSVNGNVTLKIFDVLGREVATLLNNEEMEEGKQEVEWDASKFSGGVYFYRLQVSENGKQFFTQTKKLLLMK